MSYIHAIPMEEAEGTLREVYEGDLERIGYIPNYASALSLRPDVLVAWRNLLKSIRRHMRIRRFELATFAAAAAMKCTY